MIHLRDLNFVSSQSASWDTVLELLAQFFLFCNIKSAIEATTERVTNMEMMNLKKTMHKSCINFIKIFSRK